MERVPKPHTGWGFVLGFVISSTERTGGYAAQEALLLGDSTSWFVVIPFGIRCLLNKTFQSVNELTRLKLWNERHRRKNDKNGCSDTIEYAPDARVTDKNFVCTQFVLKSERKIPKVKVLNALIA